MQRHAAGYVGIIVANHHMPVHLRVDKAENHSLITHEGLVVTLHIRYRFLIGTTVGKLPENRCRMPVLILLFLEGLDPIIRNTHCHTIVEAYTAVLERYGKAGHTAHFLGDSDCLGAHFVDEHIGKGQGIR